MGSAIFPEGLNVEDGDGRFREHTIEQLIEVSNHEVGQKAWVSARARKLFNLGVEFRCRRLGIGTVMVGDSLRLNRKIRLNADGDDVEFVPDVA